MEHNTLIRYGFEKGIEQTVFDPESESESQLAIQHVIHPRFDFDEPKPKSTADKKRKCTYGNSAKHVPPIPTTIPTTPLRPNNSLTKSSKTAFLDGLSKQIMSSIHDPLPTGCIWSQADWSCAYVIFYMIFLYMHHLSTNLWTNI